MTASRASQPLVPSRRDLLAGAGSVGLAAALGLSSPALRAALAAEQLGAWASPPDLEAENNNAVAICADIGILYGKVADQKTVVPPDMPPSAARLPASLKGEKGGWVATFTGVPAIVVNTDVIKTVARTWADLAKPEYTGKIETIDAAGGAGTSVSTFIAWAYAFGGDETNLKPAIDFAKTMVGQYASASANNQTLEKGEVPIPIRHDFNCIAAARAVKAKGVARLNRSLHLGILNVAPDFSGIGLGFAYVATLGTFGMVATLCPPLTIADAEFDAAVDILDAGLSEAAPP